MNAALAILALSVTWVAAEPSDDPFVPKPTSNEFVLKRDRDGQKPIEVGKVAKRGVTLEIESIADDHVICLLINNTDEPVYYYGTGVESPWFRFQIPWKNDQWREANMGRMCATGLYLPSLLSKHTCRFRVAAREHRFRVGLDFWRKGLARENLKNTVWSPSITNKAREGKRDDG